MIGIHDDVIIYGYTREDRDSNFLNVCQMEGLCLSSKKLELRRDKVSFFGAIYSWEGVHPDPKKVQGIEGAGSQVHSSVRPQASGNDPSEEHAQHTSTS